MMLFDQKYMHATTPVQEALDRGRQELHAQIISYVAPRFGLLQACLLVEPDENGQPVYLMMDKETGRIVHEWSNPEWRNIVREWSRRAKSTLK